MKRITLLCMIYVLLFQSNVFAQNDQYAHWSIALKAGANRAQYVGGLSSGEGYGFTAGAELERTFNPLWGLMLDYTYLNYSTGNTNARTHETALLASANLSNLVAKYRRGNWQKLNVYGKLGGGLSFYNAANSGATVVLPIGASVEYNISSLLAIALTGERRWHSSSTMGYNRTLAPAGPTMWSAMVSLRFKFGKKSHIRDTRLSDYESNFAPLQNINQEVPVNDQKVNDPESQRQPLNADVAKNKADIAATNQHIKDLEEALKDLHTDKTDEISFTKTAHFSINSSEIQPSFYFDLDNLVQLLDSHKDLKVLIIGHTDNTGTESLNENLSIERAKSVAEYLKSKGINASRIKTEGAGKSRPIATNETEEGRRTNRRIEFVLQK